MFYTRVLHTIFKSRDVTFTVIVINKIFIYVDILFTYTYLQIFRDIEGFLWILEGEVIFTSPPPLNRSSKDVPPNRVKDPAIVHGINIIQGRNKFVC